MMLQFLGGPGRNRTTDTRIFNLRVASPTTPSVCRIKVLLRLVSFTWIVTDTIPCQSRWRIAPQFCLPIPYFQNKHHGCSDREIRTMDRLKTGRFRCAGAGGTRYLPDAMVSPSPHPSPRFTINTGGGQSTDAPCSPNIKRYEPSWDGGRACEFPVCVSVAVVVGFVHQLG